MAAIFKMEAKYYKFKHKTAAKSDIQAIFYCHVHGAVSGV